MIHENVEKIRKAKGVTKTHLAKKLNLSLQGYRHITSGEVKLDVERLNVIAKSLGVSPAIFFDNKLTESVIKDLNQANSKEVI
ncbi:helix-turn-helix domain-containing protein [Salinibacillus xinjiangensis]|uniref:Helix-turn-helix domain-containing protein n=1 Tax=Salinibacillus xinjiangensis TaxID=1229268 RepID=A0A6G1X7W6_9BACI|nr:helix-turn-helix transcriptional regulator [Salinibacillus xinjiangensis]MRG86970.1 helix-turn-helix domain-containing protein [Salinibacillus xinjiangensis]